LVAADSVTEAVKHLPTIADDKYDQCSTDPASTDDKYDQCSTDPASTEATTAFWQWPIIIITTSQALV
jgi:hypothetical protein